MFLFPPRLVFYFAAGVFRVARYSIKSRSSRFVMTICIPGGMPLGPLMRSLTSSVLTVTRPSSGELMSNSP